MQSKNPVFARREEFARANPQAAQYGQPQQPYGQPQQPYGQPQYGQLSPEQLGQMYQAPSAGPLQTGRMTYDDVVIRTGTMFAVLLATAALTWFAVTGNVGLVFPLWIGSMLVGLGLALFISFSKKVRPAAILAYAAVEGVFLGSISFAFENMFDLNGIVFQAVLATLGAFAAMLLAYKTKVIRATPKFTRFLIIATIGYAVFSLFNFVAVMVFNVAERLQHGTAGCGHQHPGCRPGVAEPHPRLRLHRAGRERRSAAAVLVGRSLRARGDAGVAVHRDAEADRHPAGQRLTSRDDDDDPARELRRVVARLAHSGITRADGRGAPRPAVPRRHRGGRRGAPASPGAPASRRTRSPTS